MNSFSPSIFYSALLFAAALLPAVSVADVSTEQKAEVDHLINFVSNTQCTLKRNFSYHSGKDAIAHIQKKYDHFKDEIKTTEDFIRLSASKSLLTGRAYQVRCGEADLLKSNTWLSAELTKYRATHTTAQVETKDIVAPKQDIAFSI